MQFYPHGVSLTSVGQAVSASVALSSSFINNRNLAATWWNPDTASIATNITGARGSNGSGVVATGPTGPTGPVGVTGFRGNSIFLLSASWHAGGSCGTAPPCVQVDFGTVTEVGGFYTCDFGVLVSPPYYTTAVPFSIAGAGSPLYYDSYCTSPAYNVSPILGAYNTTVINTTANATSSQVVSCDSII